MAIRIRCAINQQTASFYQAHVSKCNDEEWNAAEQLGAWWQQYQNGWRVVLSSTQVDRMIYLRDILRNIEIPELGHVYLREVLKSKRLEITREIDYKDHIEHELDIIRILFPEQVLPQMIWGFEPGSFEKDGKTVHIKGESCRPRTK